MNARWYSHPAINQANSNQVLHSNGNEILAAYRGSVPRQPTELERKLPEL